MAEKGFDLSVFRMKQSDPVPTEWQALYSFGAMKHKGEVIPAPFDDLGKAFLGT